MPRRSAADLAHIAFRVAVCIAGPGFGAAREDAHVHPRLQTATGLGPLSISGGPGGRRSRSPAAAGPVVLSGAPVWSWCSSSGVLVVAWSLGEGADVCG
ncbi:hypothetical protein PAPYR_5423 [Paratrimastix pyriformis]|uniref:Secreted protein n=1 Tax=Paratrimastix pyriformis TaxID=342808 RepID=A0ABQ8UPP1_9EUKA|nr:hypothetical protein PAPYR_5423 [Paratrimastix pyriformis]